MRTQRETTQEEAPRVCKFCGRRIDKGANGRREYCNFAHRQAAYRQRKRQREALRA